jgi:phosphatidylserine/phosphatidylglycerophosphate/cardiolipin synthase-like enzyme
MVLDVQRRPGEAASDLELLDRFARRFQEQAWPGERLPQLCYDPRSLAADAARRSSLHAKCVVIDRRTALVSSAKCTEADQERTIEVGVLIRWPAFAERIADHFESLAGRGMLLPVPSRQ